MKKLSLKISRGDVFDVIKGVLFSLIFCFSFVLVFALIAKYAVVGDKTISIVNTVLKIVSILGGCLLGIKNPSKGALKGLLIGLLFSLLSFLLFLTINGGNATNTISMFDVLFSALGGAIAGILSVNIKGKR